MSEALNPTPDEQLAETANRNNLRGSSLMLVGRMLAVAIGFITQLLIVRALTKSDFGSFAYVLSMLLIGSAIARMGMDRALSRFVPLYLEQDDLPRAAGVIFYVLGSIALVGCALTGAVFLAQGLLSRWLISDPGTVSLLVMMAILAPFEGLENALQKLLAILAHPRTVFWRRHLVGPILKLSAALPLVFFVSNVYLLGWLYIAARILGTMLSATLVWRELRKSRVLAHAQHGRRQIPVGQIVGYSLPLLSNDVALAVRTSMVTIFLDIFHGVTFVASYRAVLPLARLNLLVSDSFRLLYTPAASRLCARDDKQGLSSLYWSNATWIALLTFPVFIATCCFARPLVLWLFGERYVESAAVLALVSLGNYLNAIFGFNAVTLRMLGHVRAVVVNDIVAVLAAILLHLTLIPLYGVLGAAIAACSTNILQNLLSQFALYRAGVVGSVPWRCLRVYVFAAATASVVFVLQSLWIRSLWLAASLAVVASVVFFRFNARSLDLFGVFPELQRVAPLRLLLGAKGDAS